MALRLRDQERWRRFVTPRRASEEEIRRVERETAGEELADLELWHGVHEAAEAAGLDPAAAVARADALHWPGGEPWPEGYERYLARCTPFTRPLMQEIA